MLERRASEERRICVVFVGVIAGTGAGTFFLGTSGFTSPTDFRGFKTLVFKAREFPVFLSPGGPRRVVVAFFGANTWVRVFDPVATGDLGGV